VSVAGAPATEDIHDLRRRLAEAEDTLRAIREGEADALVVRSDDRDEIFALSGGDDAYRAFMEAMDIGALALDAQGKLLYANAAVPELLGCDAGQLQGKGLATILGADNGRILSELIGNAAAGRHQTQMVIGAGAEQRHLVITAAPLRLAFNTGTALTMTDVTARARAAAAQESERIGRAVMASVNEPVIVCDRKGIVINANAAVGTIIDFDPVGRRFDEAFPRIFPIGSGVMHADDLVVIANDGNALKALEASAPFADPPKELLVSVAPLTLSGEAVGGCAITLIDLSERKAIEKRQSLLMRELDHRVKNTLTMVLSISGRTISGSHDLADFRTRFTSRLQALAATHTLLADASWAGLSVSALIQTELAPYVSSNGPKLLTSGLNFSVDPDVAIALGLTIHELVTNAVKYGALSRDSGTVEIAAQRLANGMIELLWTERGGPSVEPPHEQGFGHTLIARSLKRGEGTGATVEFHPGGLMCRMVVPSAD